MRASRARAVSPFGRLPRSDDRGEARHPRFRLRAAAHSGLKVDGKRIVTSDELLENTESQAPHRARAGAVGVEFASVYERFGTSDDRRDAPAPLALEDDDISTEFEKSMRRRKVKFLTSGRWRSRAGRRRGEVHRHLAEGTEVLEAEMFLCAVGRRPVTENLDLEKFPKVKLERGYVLVDPKTLLTGEPWLSASAT